MLWLLIKGLQVYVSTDDNILYTVFNWEVTVGHREEYDAWENARIVTAQKSNCCYANFRWKSPHPYLKAFEEMRMK